MKNSIDVGGGPSGPSIEGLFCRTVHLCRTFEDRKIEKKSEKKREKNKEKRKNRNKRERNEKKSEKNNGPRQNVRGFC